MKTKHLLATGLLALTLTFVADQPVLAAAFVPGEILIPDYGHSVWGYSADGTLLQTYTSTGSAVSQTALTPEGNLVTGFLVPGHYGLNITNPNGTVITSFAATGVQVNGDVSVFPDGTLALVDQFSNNVQFRSPTGVLLQTVSLPGLANAYGTTVGADGLLYVTAIDSRNMARVNAAGTWLGNISLGFQPGDVVMNPRDGTLWFSGYGNGQVMHSRTDGTLLGSFPTGFITAFSGIGLAPDNNSVFVAALNGPVKHFDLSGHLLGSFPLPGPNGGSVFLTVVPNPTPEPGCAALLGLGALLLAARRRA